MLNRIIRLFIVIFSILFALRVITFLASDRLYSMSLSAKSPEEGIELIQTAEALDSSNAELYFSEFKLLESIISRSEDHDLIKTYRKRQVFLIKKAIDLSPSKALYHMYYAITLRRMSPNPNAVTKSVILSETQKASELRPYSEIYARILAGQRERFVE